MIVAIVVCIGIGCLFGLGILAGAMIRFGNPTVEEPLPFEQPDPRLLDLHHELHTTRWTV